MKKDYLDSFSFLEKYKGEYFNGEWPTFQEQFNITCARFGDRPFFTEFLPEKVTLTFNQVREKVMQLSQWMLENGIKKGDRVAVTGKNRAEWTLVFLATGFAGGIIVPIDWGLREVEVENLLNASQPKMLFVDEEKFDHFKNNPNGRMILSLSEKHPDVYAYNLKAKNGPYEAELPTENDTLAILFTSGTTGTPKGVMLTHKNMVSDSWIAMTRMEIFETDTFYALLPLHHAYTMQAVFFICVAVGAEIVFGRTMAVTKMLKELREGKITMFLAVPLLFNKLAAGIMNGIEQKGKFVAGIVKGLLNFTYFLKKNFNSKLGSKIFGSVLDKVGMKNVRIAICGGGPLAPSVFKLFNSLGVDFVQGYGLTETSPIIALNPIWHFKIESVGQNFYPYNEMKIINPDENGIGEVVIKGPMVMKGYYNMSEATAEMFTEDGFLKTGDLGWMDKEQYLYLCGRAKNLIVTAGGKNVFPEEIENAFQLYADIEQITVVGYLLDEATKAEGIEAQIYPADQLLKSLNVKREDASKNADVIAKISGYVDEVNKTEQPYARISKITILDEPLEMTTTKKVKRNYNK